jgi:hypothetical protein
VLQLAESRCAWASARAGACGRHRRRTSRPRDHVNPPTGRIGLGSGSRGSRSQYEAGARTASITATFAYAASTTRALAGLRREIAATSKPSPCTAQKIQLDSYWLGRNKYRTYWFDHPRSTLKCSPNPPSSSCARRSRRSTAEADAPDWCSLSGSLRDFPVGGGAGRAP